MGKNKEKRDKEHKKDKKEKKEKKEADKAAKDAKAEKDKIVELAIQSKEQGKVLDQRALFKKGQTKVTPQNGDATRGFYESLLEEKPDSKQAIKYAVEYGLFPPDRHSKLLVK